MNEQKSHKTEVYLGLYASWNSYSKDVNNYIILHNLETFTKSSFIVGLYG